MLVRNETAVRQVVYDLAGNGVEIEPGAIAWSARGRPEGFRRIGSVLELAPARFVRIRRWGEMGDLLYLGRSLAALTATGVGRVVLQAAHYCLGLFEGRHEIEMSAVGPTVDVDLTGAIEAFEQERGPGLRSAAFADILGLQLNCTRPWGPDVPRGTGRHIVVQSNAAHDSRSLPADVMQEIATVAADRGPVVVVDSCRRREWDGNPLWENRTGQTGLSDLIRLVASAAAVVGMESGVAVLAESLDRPAVMLTRRRREWLAGPDWKMAVVEYDRRPGVQDVRMALGAVLGSCYRQDGTEDHSGNQLRRRDATGGEFPHR